MRRKFLVNSHPNRNGFTLIELLMVIAIILILAGITFGISRGVQNAQARTKARAELATIAQALEQFKSRYGDYPWHKSGETDTNKTLLYALTGRLVIDDPDPNDSVSNIEAIIITDENQIKRNPKFLDETKFATIGIDSETTNLLDPWGNPYMYWYKWDDRPNSYEMFGYHLYSTGAGGNTANNTIKTKINASTGLIANDFRDTANGAGIIFAGE